MTPPSDDNRDAFRPEEMDLSQLSFEQLRELKDAIVARASDRVGPEGFNPIMMATTKGDPADLFGDTDDWFTDPRDWVILIARLIYTLINVASRRVGLAIASSGMALAASHLFTTSEGARYGAGALAAAGALAVWMVVEMARSPSSLSSRG
jgi:hypothetical protein